MKRRGKKKFDPEIVILGKKHKKKQQVNGVSSKEWDNRESKIRFSFDKSVSQVSNGQGSQLAVRNRTKKKNKYNH